MWWWRSPLGAGSRRRRRQAPLVGRYACGQLLPLHLGSEATLALAGFADRFNVLVRTVEAGGVKPFGVSDAAGVVADVLARATRIGRAYSWAGEPVNTGCKDGTPSKEPPAHLYAPSIQPSRDKARTISV